MSTEEISEAIAAEVIEQVSDIFDKLVFEHNKVEEASQKEKISLEDFKKNLTKEEKEVKNYYIKHADYNDEEFEADEYEVQGNFLIFKLKGDMVYIAGSQYLVGIKHEEF